MRTVFLKTGWMKEYRGITEDDVIIYNEWETNNCFDFMEQYNFLQKNEYYYGCVSTKNRMGDYDGIHIEKLDGVSIYDDKADNVLVIWVSIDCNGTGAVKITGWYKNACLYRMYQKEGIAFYNVSAKAEDCTLLPENGRSFSVQAVSPENIWFGSDFEDPEIVNDIVKYVYDYTGEKQNIVITDDDLVRESGESLDTGEEYLEKAEKAYEEKKNLEALYLCNSVLKCGCRDADVYNLKGLILYELYQYNDSLKYYVKALEIYPQFYEVFYNMALVYEENRDFENALKSYDRYIEHFPESPEGYSGKGQIYIQTLEYEKALECFGKTVAYDPEDYDSYAFQAIAFWNLGRLKEALGSVENAIRLCPDDESNRNIKAAILEELKHS